MSQPAPHVRDNKPRIFFHKGQWLVWISIGKYPPQDFVQRAVAWCVNQNTQNLIKELP